MTDIASDSARWLKLGLGRPAIGMIQGDPKQFREPLIYSCNHWQSYAAECESRTPYLWNLIHLSREAAWYRERIVAQLREPLEDSDDYSQTFDLACRFAEQGYTDARRAMYQAVERENHPDLIYRADELIRLDGFEGLLYCLRRWKSFEGKES